MKSLEIVNYKISLFEKDKQGFTALSWFQLNDIKQDLEVLEIIRKKKVDVNLLTALLEEKLTLEEILYVINDECCELTMEELLKLKQCLEENENGNDN